MAQKLKDTKPTDIVKTAAASRQQQTTREESEKTASKKSLRIDMQPEGYDLDEYLIKASQQAGLERGTTVSKTRYIQDLIIKDMEEHKTKGSYKLTKRDKARYLIEKLDDEQIKGLAALLKVQL